LERDFLFFGGVEEGCGVRGLGISGLGGDSLWR
jgi:hypothetical protein